MVFQQKKLEKFKIFIEFYIKKIILGQKIILPQYTQAGNTNLPKFRQFALLWAFPPDFANILDVFWELKGGGPAKCLKGIPLSLCQRHLQNPPGVSPYPPLYPPIPPPISP